MKYAICLILLAISFPALAWGPHTEITKAGMDVLAPDDPIVKHLGLHFQRLPYYSWMGDYQSSLMDEPDGNQFLADDYLLFSKVPKHTSHLSPDVNKVLEPCFKRAVQALRTETPLNAARWIGTILHWTEDAGAPPHALAVGGDTHFGMENWIDKTKITIGAYKPQLLGTNEQEALAGYLRRMDGLSAYAKSIGEKTKPLVEANRRSEVEPLSLECAEENSRVVADLLHTLGAIELRDVPDSAILRGTVNPLGDHKMSAKIYLDGTDYTTITDAEGRYAFHNIPPGAYRGHFWAGGFRTRAFYVILSKGDSRTLNVSLPIDH